MKIYKHIILALSILLSFSCSNDDDLIGYNRAQDFFNYHTSEFLNSDLVKFNFNSRTQYEYIKNDSINYHVIPRSENELLIISPKEFIIQYSFPIETERDPDRAKLTLQDSFNVLEIETSEYSIPIESDGFVKIGKKFKETLTCSVNLVPIDPIKLFHH